MVRIKWKLFLSFMVKVKILLLDIQQGGFLLM